MMRRSSGGKLLVWSLTLMPWRSWSGGRHASPRAPPPSWCGWSSIPRFIPGERAPGPQICWRPAFLFSHPDEVANTPIMDPGQRVVYVMLDLRSRVPDVRRFVAALELWLIRTLGQFGVRGERRSRVGVWVAREPASRSGEDKIAAIGVRVKRFVTLHGLSLNVAPDLAHFAGIVPCGVHGSEYGVTSLAALGRRVTMADVDAMLCQEFAAIFGRCRPCDGSPPS